jgi:hypothetical protein
LTQQSSSACRASPPEVFLCISPDPFDFSRLGKEK